MSTQTGQDWQMNKRSVQERNACMFNNAEMSDIQLSCGETSKDIFYAHKYVLATSSPVFHRMFYGSLPETSSVVHLTDADKESLDAFLRYLYTDETPDSPDLTLKVMHLAHKYMITALVEECVKIVKKKMTAQNACLMLTYGMLIEQQSLIESSWQVVDSETREVIKAESFCEIDAALLCDFMKRDSLRITEIELFHAVLKWSEYQCRKRDLEVSVENKRSVLGDAFYNLRFLAMSQDEFLREVIPTGLLRSDDSLSILQKFLGHHQASLKWPVAKKRSDYWRYSRFEKKNIQVPTSTWRYLIALLQRYKFNKNPNPHFSWDYSRRAEDCLEFKLVNSNIKTAESRREKPELEAVMFHGVRVFGDAHGSTYHVTMTIDNREVVSGTYTSEQTRCNSYGFDVVLSKPVGIQLTSTWISDGWYGKKAVQYPRSYTLASRSYTIKLLILGPRSYYGVRGKKTVKMCEHIYIEFDECHLARHENNGTDVNRGQIFQLLITPSQPCKACQGTQPVMDFCQENM